MNYRPSDRIANIIVHLLTNTCGLSGTEGTSHVHSIIISQCTHTSQCHLRHEGDVCWCTCTMHSLTCARCSLRRFLVDEEQVCCALERDWLTSLCSCHLIYTAYSMWTFLIACSSTEQQRR